MKTPAKIKSLCCIIFLFGFNVYSQNNIIPNNGNVGLGTLTPSAKLDVNGNVHIDSTLIVKDSILVNKNQRIIGNLTVENEVKFTNLNEINNIDGNYDFLVGKNGKVKYVTKTTFLDVLEKEFYEEKECAVGIIPNPTWANGENKIYVKCPQVNVGIGTNEPKFNLDVRGTSFSSRLALGILPTGDVPYFFHLKTALPQNANSKLFVIENQARKIFQVNNNGLVLAREIKLDTQNWPDYAFAPEYKLMSLEELEKYVLTFRHLPNIPDAATMSENGVNVEEMNEKFLLQMEEITLYLIGQNKVLKEQKTELEIQNEKILSLEEKIKALELLLQK